MFSEGQRVEVPLSAKLIRDERILKTPLSLMVSYFPMRLGVVWASRMTPGVMTMGLDLTFYDTSLPKGINNFYLDYPTSYISNQRHKLLPPTPFSSGYIGYLVWLTGFSTSAWPYLLHHTCDRISWTRGHPLHWEADSQWLDHQESPYCSLFT